MDINASICEKIEITVFSDGELSDEMKTHAQECPICRQFLEQNEKLIHDLKKLDVTGLQEGKITQAVMSKITQQKKRSFKGFEFTHHLGTAAALVIICAVALYVKNVQPNDNPVTYVNDMAQETSKDGNETKVLYNARFTASVEESEKNAYDYEYATEQESYNDTVAKGDEVPALLYDEEAVDNATDYADGISAPKLSVKNTAVQDESQTVTQTQDELSSNVQFAPSEQEHLSEELRKSENALSDNGVCEKAAPVEQALPEATVIEKWEPEENDECAAETEEEMILGGGGGSSGGGSTSAVYAQDDKQSEKPEEDKYSKNYVVFEGLDFLQGEENIDVNIAIANQRLGMLYGDDFCVISRYSLENNGWGGNSFFFETAPTLTYSMLLEIENSSSPITDK